jgi:von Willebrand factor type A domain
LCARSKPVLRQDQPPGIRVRWAAANVQIHSTGIQLIHHPVVGNLDLSFASFPFAGRSEPDAPTPR